MAEELDAQTKLKVYKLVLNRYRDLISEKESRSITEIRARVSPYDDVIRRLSYSFTHDMVPYNPATQFMAAAERAMEYMRKIKTLEFAFTFWMDFKEMDDLKIATAMDKAIMLAAILRALESSDVRVQVSRKGKPSVRFSWDGRQYVFVPESGSLLMGDDVSKLVSDDPIAYSFNDNVYENYEEL
ncbi:MAG: hypothetical protein AB1295_02895 [Candidatus Micrarchaeota archaeon]